MLLRKLYDHIRYVRQLSILSHVISSFKKRKCDFTLTVSTVYDSSAPKTSLSIIWYYRCKCVHFPIKARAILMIIPGLCQCTSYFTIKVGGNRSLCQIYYENPIKHIFGLLLTTGLSFHIYCWKYNVSSRLCTTARKWKVRL